MRHQPCSLCKASPTAVASSLMRLLNVDPPGRSDSFSPSHASFVTPKLRPCRLALNYAIKLGSELFNFRTYLVNPERFEFCSMDRSLHRFISLYSIRNERGES